MGGSNQWHSAPGSVTKRALQTLKSFDPKSPRKRFQHRAERLSIIIREGNWYLISIIGQYPSKLSGNLIGRAAYQANCFGICP